MRRPTASFALLVLLLLPAAGAAQTSSAAMATEELARYDAPSALPGWKGEATLLAGNALMGGVVTGIVRELRGGSFRQGFVSGVSGSAVAYAGRRLSVVDVDGAAFAGRQLNALGASVVRNGLAGQPALSTVVLPLGPTRVYLDRSTPGHTRWHVKLNAYELYWVARGALDPELELQWSATLASGAPVFQKRSGRLDVGGSDVNGYQLGGAIFLSGEAGLGQNWTLAHERVHVLQADFMAIAWLDPAEGWLMQQSAPTRALSRVFDVGLLDTALTTALVRALHVRFRNAHEFEAELLESR